MEGDSSSDSDEEKVENTSSTNLNSSYSSNYTYSDLMNQSFMSVSSNTLLTSSSSMDNSK